MAQICPIYHFGKLENCYAGQWRYTQITGLLEVYAADTGVEFERRLTGESGLYKSHQRPVREPQWSQIDSLMANASVDTVGLSNKRCFNRLYAGGLELEGLWCPANLI